MEKIDLALCIYFHELAQAEIMKHISLQGVWDVLQRDSAPILLPGSVKMDMLGETGTKELDKILSTPRMLK